MNEILIKPHHFIDIIKLYGSGIKVFVPDEKMGHDFYKVANAVIDDPQVILRLTLFGDDICQPCLKYKEQCTDSLSTIPGYTSKNEYNISLDKKIIELYHLFQESYTAFEFCSIIFKEKENIFKVWCEENQEITKKRYQLFCIGAKQYLSKGKNMNIWHDIKTQEDIDKLMDIYNRFHDSCIVSVIYKSGTFVDDEGAMNFGSKADHELLVVFHRQGDPKILELCFSGVSQVCLKGWNNNYTCEIYEAFLLFQDMILSGKSEKMIIWSDDSHFHLEKSNDHKHTYIFASALKWRI